MRPNARLTYALRALVELGLRQGTGPVTMAAIAKRQGIPLRSLEQLFNLLRRKGLVEAERGPRGGYRLRLVPGEIPIRAIFEILQPTGAGGRGAKRSLPKGNGSHDPARVVWQQVQKAVQSTLEATTLDDLIEQARAQEGAPIRHRFTFHI